MPIHRKSAFVLPIRAVFQRQGGEVRIHHHGALCLALLAEFAQERPTSRPRLKQPHVGLRKPLGNGQRTGDIVARPGRSDAEAWKTSGAGPEPSGGEREGVPLAIRKRAPKALAAGHCYRMPYACTGSQVTSASHR